MFYVFYLGVPRSYFLCAFNHDCTLGISPIDHNVTLNPDVVTRISGVICTPAIQGMNLTMTEKGNTLPVNLVSVSTNMKLQVPAVATSLKHTKGSGDR